MEVFIPIIILLIPSVVLALEFLTWQLLYCTDNFIVQLVDRMYYGFHKSIIQLNILLAKYSQYTLHSITAFGCKLSHLGAHFISIFIESFEVLLKQVASFTGKAFTIAVNCVSHVASFLISCALVHLEATMDALKSYAQNIYALLLQITYHAYLISEQLREWILMTIRTDKSTAMLESMMLVWGNVHYMFVLTISSSFDLLNSWQPVIQEYLTNTSQYVIFLSEYLTVVSSFTEQVVYIAVGVSCDVARFVIDSTLVVLERMIDLLRLSGQNISASILQITNCAYLISEEVREWIIMTFTTDNFTKILESMLLVWDNVHYMFVLTISSSFDLLNSWQPVIQEYLTNTSQYVICLNEYLTVVSSFTEQVFYIAVGVSCDVARFVVDSTLVVLESMKDLLRLSGQNISASILQITNCAYLISEEVREWIIMTFPTDNFTKILESMLLVWDNVHYVFVLTISSSFDLLKSWQPVIQEYLTNTSQCVICLDKYLTVVSSFTEQMFYVAVHIVSDFARFVVNSALVVFGSMKDLLILSGQNISALLLQIIYHAYLILEQARGWIIMTFTTDNLKAMLESMMLVWDNVSYLFVLAISSSFNLLKSWQPVILEFLTNTLWAVMDLQKYLTVVSAFTEKTFSIAADLICPVASYVANGTMEVVESMRDLLILLGKNISVFILETVKDVFVSIGQFGEWIGMKFTTDNLTTILESVILVLENVSHAFFSIIASSFELLKSWLPVVLEFLRKTSHILLGLKSYFSLVSFWSIIVMLICFAIFILVTSIYAFHKAMALLRMASNFLACLWQRRYLIQDPPERIEQEREEAAEEILLENGSHNNAGRYDERAAFVECERRSVISGHEPVQEEEEDLPLCIVCQDEKRSTLLLPCRHLCLCRNCADEIQRILGRTCPVCRAYIQEIVDVYI